ncbi:N-acetyltransferase family protein [Blastococcus sp. CT_GayMR20]|uniref:GNAT family N-acetyltransferase n=1 Tax=Blastococcus sp. CT_GayMR20 TaxID=2559609 RepID=UPI001074674C|nr:GNAT family N-acetyltransferase [Blastococcus sp. CT_GayMR20]TFV80802.1 N-acetyltransferase family protein [Blastococcus sp. CT_GayMR20]
MTDRDGTTVRDAGPADAARCAAIYEPYVRHTAISFETEPPTAEEMAGRIAEAQRRHAWLVLDDDGTVTGYAYGGPFMARAAYSWSASVSVYLEPGRRRTGAGRTLYAALFDRLAARGIRTVLAGIALPNDASTGLHRALGFDEVGTYRRVGWKHGRWHDVVWYQRDLRRDAGPPEQFP